MNKLTRYLAFVFLSLMFLACSEPTKPSFAFYYWKSKAAISDIELQALEQTQSNKLYLRYFDVDKVKESNNNDSGIYPISVLRTVSDEIKNFEIIPVIFIVNKVLKEHPNINQLSKQIGDLIEEMHLQHFNTKPKEVQIDCDWTGSTKTSYFELLALLKKRFNLSVTIRLHQLKYQNKTGIPPVEKGVLMVYNVGDLDNFEQNSILESKIVAQYVNEQTNYPMQLDIALPLFSQMVLKNNDDELKLLTGTDRAILTENKTHFKQKSNNVFQVKKDTLYRGFYLYENFEIKLEEIELEEVVKSYKIIKASRLDVKNVLFYHLDEKTLEQIDLNYLLEKL